MTLKKKCENFAKQNNLISFLYNASSGKVLELLKRSSYYCLFKITEQTDLNDFLPVIDALNKGSNEIPEHPNLVYVSR